MNALRTLRCRTVAGGCFRQMNHVRGLPPLAVDEPSGIPGAEPAPQPLEVLLSALGSCLAAGIRANAVARGIALSRLELEVEADIAAAPMDEACPEPLGLDAVRVAVHIESVAPRDALAALVARATLRSPVANTLHDGAHLDVALTPPRRE
jgi:uncharacterized OsmC-like protein